MNPDQIEEASRSATLSMSGVPYFGQGIAMGIGLLVIYTMAAAIIEAKKVVVSLPFR